MEAKENTLDKLISSAGNVQKVLSLLFADLAIRRVTRIGISRILVASFVLVRVATAGSSGWLHPQIDVYPIFVFAPISIHFKCFTVQRRVLLHSPWIENPYEVNAWISIEIHFIQMDIHRSMNNWRLISIKHGYPFMDIYCLGYPLRNVLARISVWISMLVWII